MTHRAAVARAARLLACALLTLGQPQCTPKNDPDPLVERATFGVFFGGQIQDRKELPFELDPAKQQQGIRIDFRAPLTRAAKVEWEIARPLGTKVAKLDAGNSEVVEVGEVTARVGESRLDVPVSFRHGQVLGSWHVRAKVDTRVVLERDVLVFDARERRELDRAR